MGTAQNDGHVEHTFQHPGVSPGGYNLRGVGGDAYHIGREGTGRRRQGLLLHVAIVDQKLVAALLGDGGQVGQAQRRRRPGIDGQP